MQENEYICLLCGGKLRRSLGFELFCEDDKMMEDYLVYECQENKSHIVEIMKSKEYNANALLGSYKRYAIEREQTNKKCPICRHPLEYLGDDATEYDDWFFHYRRYICRTNGHLVRARGGKIHNDRPSWETYDKAVFGYSKSEDDELR